MQFNQFIKFGDGPDGVRIVLIVAVDVAIVAVVVPSVVAGILSTFCFGDITINDSKQSFL